MQGQRKSPFQKGRIIRDDGRVKIGIINSSELDSTCWSIQFWGVEACKDCEFLGTSACGGSKEVREYLEKNLLKPNMAEFKPQPLQVKPFGQVVGRYPIPFLKEVFDYASRYDVEKGPQEEGFIFDRRIGAINVWDWKKGVIYTTLYVNWATGDVTLQKGTLKEDDNWTPGDSAKFWNRVFANVSSNKPTVPFDKEE